MPRSVVASTNCERYAQRRCTLRRVLAILVTLIACSRETASQPGNSAKRAQSLIFEYGSAVDAKNYVRLEELADKTVVAFLQLEAGREGKDYKELLANTGIYVTRISKHPLATFQNEHAIGYLTWCTWTHRYPDHPEAWPTSDGVCALYVGEARVLDRVTGTERASRGWDRNPERESSEWRVATVYDSAGTINRMVKPLDTVRSNDYARIEQVLKSMDTSLFAKAFFDNNGAAHDALEAQLTKALQSAK